MRFPIINGELLSGNALSPPPLNEKKKGGTLFKRKPSYGAYFVVEGCDYEIEFELIDVSDDLSCGYILDNLNIEHDFVYFVKFDSVQNILSKEYYKRLGADSTIGFNGMCDLITFVGRYVIDFMIAYDQEYVLAVANDETLQRWYNTVMDNLHIEGVEAFGYHDHVQGHDIIVVRRVGSRGC